MFRLYQQAFLAALEDWGNLSKKLQAEKETTQRIVNTMSQAWVGETQRDNENILRDMITTGLYQQTAEIVEKVYRLQYNEMPNIIAQMARCEKMGEQLLQDSHLSPYIDGFGYYNDGYLTLDDTHVGAFNCAVTEVLTQAGEARSVLYEAMNACDGMIDFSDECATLEAGYRKVSRIQNFSAEFNTYVIEVKAIQEALTSGFRAIIAEDPDPTNQKWNLVLQNLRAHKNIGYSIMQMSKTRMVAGFSTMEEPIEELTVEQVEIILQKPVSEWTQLEAEQVAHAYTQAIENRDVEMLNAITESLLVEEKGDMTLYVRRDAITQTQAINDPSAYYQGEYSAHLDMDKCEKILAYIDPKTQGEAYYTMTRILNYGGYTGTIQYGVYTDESKRGAELEFYVEDGVLKFQSTFLLGDGNGRNKVGFEVRDLYGELSDEAIANMKSLNFTEDAIAQILAKVATDKDIEYTYELMEANTQEDYKGLFAQNPDKLSIGGQNAFAAYAYGLYVNNMVLDENGNILSEDYTQLTTMLNAMMSKSTKISVATGLDGMVYPAIDARSNYRNEYLAILSVCNKELLEVNSCLIGINYDNLEKEDLYRQYQIKNMYTLVESLRQMEAYYSSGNILENILNLFGDQSTTISDLKTGTNENNKVNNICDAQFTYNISTNRMMIESEKMMSMVELTSIDPQTAEQKNEVNAYYSKVDAARKAERDANIKVALDTLELVCPKIKPIKDKVKYFTNKPDQFDIAKDVNDFVVKDKEKNKAVGKGIGIAKSYYSAYKDVQKAYAAMNSSYNEILDDMYEDAALMNVDDWGNINIAQGMYDPEQIVKKAMFDNEGFSFLAADEQNISKGTKAINVCKGVDANVLNRHFSADAYETGTLTKRTDEEKMQILHLYWTGPKTDADRELLAAIADDEKSAFMDTLNDILEKNEISFKNSSVKNNINVHSIYNSYEVNLR